MSDAQPVAFLDTNVLVRHLTGDPPEMAVRATRYLREATTLLLVDIVVAELVFVLESYYRQPRGAVAQAIRAVIGFPAVRLIDGDLVRRAVEVYEDDRLDFAEAYLVASAERSGVGVVASFDRSIDRAGTVRRVEPGAA